MTGVRFGFRETRVFDGLALRIAPGEMVGLIGPNGSGKTTLLRLLSGALSAGSGEVMVAGRPAGDWPARERARQVAVVPQESAAAFDFTVMETVLMGRTPYLGLLGLEGPEDVRIAEEALRRTGMLDFAGRLLSHLSGGERQLVFVARALAQRARIMLLDEPTSWLDIRHRQEIYALLSRLNREEGLTILTTSHDINLAARWCPRMILLNQGRIRADGAPARVFEPQVLSEVYGTPLRVIADPESGIPWAFPSGAAARASGPQR
jgi:iron complex transport system ATP-binding protein